MDFASAHAVCSTQGVLTAIRMYIYLIYSYCVRHSSHCCLQGWMCTLLAVVFPELPSGGSHRAVLPAAFPLLWRRWVAHSIPIIVTGRTEPSVRVWGGRCVLCRSSWVGEDLWVLGFVGTSSSGSVPQTWSGVWCLEELCGVVVSAPALHQDGRSSGLPEIPLSLPTQWL